MIEASAMSTRRTRVAPPKFALRVRVPSVVPEVGVVRVMEGSQFAPDLRSIMRGREALSEFIKRVDICITELLLAPRGDVPLLREAMETAVRAHHLTPNTERRAEAARFIAATVSVVANGLLGYDIWGIDAEAGLPWRPHEDGQLREFLRVHDVQELGFDLRHPPNQAQRRVMRYVVAGWVCTFEDLVLMEHSGIDYRSFEI